MSPGEEPSGAARFRFDRTWEFAVPPERFWDAVSRPSAFRQWWPWLRELDGDGDGLVEGAVVRCVVRAPLPYRLRLDLSVRRVVPCELVTVDVDGDIRGPASLEISGARAGTRARLVWDVALRRPMLRAAARVARPAMEWGHDWVVNTGVEQFRRRGLGVDTGHDDRT